MVKPAKTKKVIDQAKAAAFANMADSDVNDNKPIAVNKPKRGNPRAKKNKTVSFSIPIELDEKIDEAIEELAQEGMFGISRSDVVVAALTAETMSNSETISKEIKRVKGIK
ncbi:ribbon-helix-helix domain-containing protein [Photobacterium sp. ZSDE20]|nr:ribbon-helix-helix domain-containing protein [Photobacterium sp. ZSDE20]